MGFAEAVRTCFRKYFRFSGRASRPEYWWFFLFLVLGSAAAGILDGALFGPRTEGGSGPLAGLFSLATFIPALAAGWRRMHDTGRSGLYLFYPLIVMIGTGTFAAFTGAFEGGGGLASAILILGLLVFLISPLLVLWWLTRPSEPGPNAYGPNPHEVTA